MNRINFKLLFNFIIISLGISNYTYCQNIIQKDLYGRIVLKENGQKINYQSYSKKSNLLVSNKTSYTIENNSQSSIVKDTIDLEVSTIYADYGYGIGNKSMLTNDIDNDGIIELICTGQYNGYYWYELQYNQLDNTCSQKYTSQLFEFPITCFEVIDLNGDNQNEILMGFENGTIKIYNSINKLLIKEITGLEGPVNDIIYADADNDGTKELVFTYGHKTVIMNIESFYVEYEIPSGGNQVRVGNVNNDPYNEIILSSGYVYQLINSNIKLEWTFGSYELKFVELSDIDNDSKEEIISAQTWSEINVYDEDLKATKYSIPTALDIDALLVKDINNDGIEEILYGDGQWGKIHCINPISGNEIWSVINYNHGTTGICYEDLDKDGNQELIWGSGFSSTGPDNLYIYNKTENVLEWVSPCTSGSYSAISIGDVDDDGKNEIVTLSYIQEEYYQGGVVSVYDGESKELKWKYTGTPLEGKWDLLYNVAINDIDNDGVNEIVIATGVTFAGEICVIDAKNHTLKSDHNFSSQNVDQLISLIAEDVDDDGKTEIIATDWAKIHIIDPLNWTIKWSAQASVFCEFEPIIKVANVDTSRAKEIIFCNGAIAIINTLDHSCWISPNNYYISIDTCDYDNNGITDIIASTSSGKIIVIDGQTKSVLKEFNLEHQYINSVKVLPQGDEKIIMYSCNGRLNFFLNDTNYSVSQYLGYNVGAIEGFKFYKWNPDSIDLIVGTPSSVLNINASFLNCFGFKTAIERINVSCNDNDGKIKLSPSGGTSPYTIKWNNNSESDSLANLTSGFYSFTIRDSKGCSISKELSLERNYLQAKFNIVNEGCNDDFLGSIQSDLIKVVPPYTFNWSNFKTSEDIDSLKAGNYSVTITDSKSCTLDKTIEVSRDTIIFEASISDISCFGEKNGSILINIIQGEEPYEYNWDTGESTFYRYELDSGDYSVEITDAFGCKSNGTFKINNPEKISYKITTTPDYSNTTQWEGTASISDIKGGTPPYSVFWPDAFTNGTSIHSLFAGKLKFIITDDSYCETSDTAVIASAVTNIENFDQFIYLYPNPVENNLYINFYSNSDFGYRYELIDSEGRILNNFKSRNRNEVIDFSNLQTGIYFLRIFLDDNIYTEKIIKQ